MLLPDWSDGCMTIRQTILSIFEQVAKERDVKFRNALNDNMILLDSGLDSLAFAVIVTQLEDTLGFDPFTLSEEAYYPVTLGQFITFYEKMQAYQ
jgi:acyl carrier protein